MSTSTEHRSSRPVRVRSGGVNTPPRTDGQATSDKTDETGHKPDSKPDALLYVPERLADMPLERMRALAFRLVDFIDGPDHPYEERISYMPEYLRLVERINFRMESAS